MPARLILSKESPPAAASLMPYSPELSFLSWMPPKLFLEQAIKCRPRIVRVARRWLRAILGKSHHWRGRQRIARHRHARRKQLARVRLVFQRNALRNRLQALKARGGIEMHTLLAAMQTCSALRTISPEIDVRRKRCPALETA